MPSRVEDGSVGTFGDVWDGSKWEILLEEDFYTVDEQAELVAVEGAEDDGADIEHRLVVEPLEGSSRRIWATAASWPALAIRLEVVGKLLGGRTLVEEMAAPSGSRYYMIWTPIKAGAGWVGKTPKEEL